MGLIHLEFSTHEEIKKLDKENFVVIIPTGSYEQHGPHLPINTDSFLISEIALRAAEKTVEFKPELNILLVPPLKIGISPHHMSFAGSITLTSSTYIRVIEELCESISHHGFKRIILLNGHGANKCCLQVAARNVRNRMDVLIAVVPYWDCAVEEIANVRESEDGGICHAGEMETSCMLYLENNLVRKDKIEERMPKPISRFIKLDLLKKGIAINHNVLDFSENGVIGNPILASSKKGEKFLNGIIGGVTNFIIDFSRWNFNNLNQKVSK